MVQPGQGGLLRLRGARAALNGRIAIEQAKGVLAERWQVGIDQAFGVLPTGLFPQA